jgi:superfamily I DNA/RNA helicase
VERLAEEEVWNPGQVALLTTKYRHPEHDRLKSDPDKYWQGYWDGEDVFYGTVQGFKGLERSVVVLAVNGIHANSDIRDMLYVGASRARDRLVVVTDTNMRASLTK